MDTAKQTSQASCFNLYSARTLPHAIQHPPGLSLNRALNKNKFPNESQHGYTSCYGT